MLSFVFCFFSFPAPSRPAASSAPKPSSSTASKAGVPAPAKTSKYVFQTPRSVVARCCVAIKVTVVHLGVSYQAASNAVFVTPVSTWHHFATHTFHLFHWTELCNSPKQLNDRVSLFTQMPWKSSGSQPRPLWNWGHHRVRFQFKTMSQSNRNNRRKGP